MFRAIGGVMRNHSAVMAIAVIVTGCAGPQPSKPFPQPKEELAVAGAAGRQGAGASKLGVKAMTQQELRTCAATISTVGDLSRTLSSQNGALKTDKAKISADEKQLQLDRSKVDESSSKQVESFNARLNALHDVMRSFNKRVDEYNASVQQANQLNNSFNVSCANRPYRVRDLSVLSESEKLAMESGASSFDLPVYSDEPVPESADPPWLIRQ